MSETDIKFVEELLHGPSDADAFRLNFIAQRLTLLKGFEEMLSLRELPHLKLFPHQREAVERVLTSMGGRAILADEVGLGKTIEAGVILKEYMIRGMVRKALILVPASLLLQWRDELTDKLGMKVAVGTAPGAWEANLVLASIDTAKRAENAVEIWRNGYDILIVDEAHRLKASSTLNWKFVNRIRKKYLLLLTATPMQNELKELYNMVTLLKPGQLKTFPKFRREFMLDKRTPKNPGELRRLLMPVLVRHTRRESGIAFPDRMVSNHGTPIEGSEKVLYNLALSFVRTNYRMMVEAHSADKRRVNVLPLILLLREVCSSPKAALKTVQTMIATAERESQQPGCVSTYSDPSPLFAMRDAACRLTHNSKLGLLLKTLPEWSGEKAIVFTEFMETASFLGNALSASGIVAVLYHGGLNKEEKAKRIKAFRDEAQVMVSTEAGGEGHNLQFCRNIINFDLPWNPMRVEQRIGRVHRLGQDRDVRVINFCTEGTVEAYVLYLLDKKIHMFETIVGELDLILANLGKRSFEGRLSDLVLEARDDDELRRMVEALGDQLEEARLGYNRLNHMNSLLLDENG